MQRERYTPMNLFDLVPALSMALEPVLTQLDRLLGDDILFQAVKAGLAHRFPRTRIDGRPSRSSFGTLGRLGRDHPPSAGDCPRHRALTRG